MIRMELKKAFCHLYVIPLIAVLIVALWSMQQNQEYLSYYDYEQEVIDELQENGFSKLDENAITYIYDDIEKTIDPVYSEILTQIPFFQNNEITTRESFITWRDNSVVDSPEKSNEFNALNDQINNLFNEDEEKYRVYWKNQIYTNWLTTIDLYKKSDANEIAELFYDDVLYQNSFLTKAEYDLIQKKLDEHAWQILVTNARADLVSDFWKTVILFLLASVFVILGPYFAYDRFQDMTGTLYTTKQGRRIRILHMKTALISGAVLYLFWVIPLGSLYAYIYRLPHYWNMPVSSILCYQFCWNDVSFGTYYLMHALLALCALLISIPAVYGIVQITRNYVSLFLLSVPAVWLLYVLCAVIPLSGPVLNIRNVCSQVLHIPFSEYIYSTIMILIMVGSLLYYLKKTEKTDFFDV